MGHSTTKHCFDVLDILDNINAGNHVCTLLKIDKYVAADINLKHKFIPDGILEHFQSIYVVLARTCIKICSSLVAVM